MHLFDKHKIKEEQVMLVFPKEKPHTWTAIYKSVYLLLAINILLGCHCVDTGVTSPIELDDLSYLSWFNLKQLSAIWHMIMSK